MSKDKNSANYFNVVAAIVLVTVVELGVEMVLIVSKVLMASKIRDQKK